MRLFYFAPAIAILLAACSKPPTALPFLDRVMTTDEFTQQPDLRKRVLDACEANPGELAKDPNCINAGTSQATEAGQRAMRSDGWGGPRTPAQSDSFVLKH